MANQSDAMAVQALTQLAMGEGEGPLAVRTPDQRLRVFISSTLQELAAERAVVRQAISQLHLIPVLFESGARPYPPRRLYRSYLAQSHVFIGVYWQRYGWVAPEMDISGLEDEYLLSEGMPRLIYIKTPSPEREPGLKELLGRVQRDDAASYKYFTTPDELGDLVANDLAVLLSERFEQSRPAPAAEAQVARPRGNLPLEATHFIGREEHLAAGQELFKEEYPRLVTLTGPGGVGKTRLALRVASSLRDRFPDGVWLVDLAALTDETLVAQLAAKVLDVREEEGRPLLESVVGHIDGQAMLLILDNCERLIGGVAPFAEAVLRTAPNARILATSREPLGIAGERVWQLPPLATPELATPMAPQELALYEAVALFVDRAQAIRPAFALTAENGATVARICTRLDGIPLAIELAAARTRVLPVEEIAARLDDCFRLLVGGRTAVARQQTLQALIDWSFDLLSEKERVLLRRLAIFTGGWTLEAAEQVASGDGLEPAEILDLLTLLIDKSLVALTGSESGRYRFLETIRQYAQQRLVESGEAERLARQLADYFLALVEGCYGKLWGREQGEWLARLNDEHDNLRAALQWLDRAPERREKLLRLAGSLWRFWDVRGYISEGRDWLARALAKNEDASDYLRANGLRGAGCLARQHGEFAAARALHEQSLALFERLGYPISKARELEALGELELVTGNYERASGLHQASLALRREAGDKEGIAASHRQLGIIARDRGHYQQAQELLEESLRLNRELDDRIAIAQGLNQLGLIAHARCEYLRAIALLEEALAMNRELRDPLGIANALHSLASVLKDQGDFRRSNAQLQECLALQKELGDRPGIARTLVTLSETTFLQGNYLKAAELAEGALARFKELGAKRGVMMAYGVQAYAAIYQGNYDAATAAAEAALAVATELDAPRAKAYAAKAFGLIAYAKGNAAEALTKLQESLEMFAQLNDHRNVAHNLVGLGRTAYRSGNHAAAERYLKVSLRLSRQMGIRWSLAYSLEIMGLLKRSADQSDEARELFRESLQLSAEQENLQGIANCLGALAGMAATAGEPICAVQLFAAADKVREAIGAVMGAEDRREYDRYLDDLSEQLDDAAFAEAWAAGYEMTTEAAIELALSD
jgi:predicted ATPase